MTDSVPDGPVESLLADYADLASELQTNPSGLTALNRSFHKHLVIAAASDLEDRVKRLVPQFFADRGSIILSEFVSKRVFSRGYHTLFDWDKSNANGFFGSFGDECRANYKLALQNDDLLKSQQDSFFIIGVERNGLVHNNYANYPLSLTPQEISDHYHRAIAFIERFESLIFGELEEATSANA